MKLILGLFLIFTGTTLPGGLLDPKVAQATSADQQTQNKLDSRIQPPDREKYSKVRDGNEWLNPFLVIRPDGVEIITRVTTGERKIVSRDKLRKALISLPVSAWPYGRVIGVQHISIRSGAPGSKVWLKDDRLIAKNETEVKQTLAFLGIELNWWPSN